MRWDSASSPGPSQGQCGALGSIDAERNAGVLAEIELCQIAVQMVFIDVLINTDEAALNVARRGYRGWYASFMKLWLEHGTRPVGVVYPAEFDGEGANGRMIAGSPRSVLDQLQAQVDESGVNYIACRFAFGDLTFAETRRSVDLFAEQVMPRLRAKQRVAAE